MRRRLEKSIEKACKRWAQGRDWWCAKFKSPGKRSAPDDVFSRQFPRRQRILFVEFKAEGEEATENQKLYHEEMRRAGCEVWVIDNVDLFKSIFTLIEKHETEDRSWLAD